MCFFLTTPRLYIHFSNKVLSTKQKLVGGFNPFW